MSAIAGAVRTISVHVDTSDDRRDARAAVVGAIAQLGREKQLLLLRLVARGFGESARCFTDVAAQARAAKGSGGSARSWMQQVAATVMFVVFCLGGEATSTALDAVKSDLPECDVDSDSSGSDSNGSSIEFAALGSPSTTKKRAHDDEHSALPQMLSQGVAHDPTGTEAGRIRDAIAFPDGVVRLLQAVFESKSLGALGALLRLVEVLAKGRVLDAAVSRRWAATAAQLDNFFALVKTMGCFSSAAWRGLNKMWVVITARLGIEFAAGGALPSLAAVRDTVKHALHNYDARLLGMNHGLRGISVTVASGAGCDDSEDDDDVPASGIQSILSDELSSPERRAVHLRFVEEFRFILLKIGLDNAHITKTETKLTSLWMVPMSSLTMAHSVLYVSSLGVCNTKDTYAALVLHFQRIFTDMGLLALNGMALDSSNVDFIDLAAKISGSSVSSPPSVPVEAFAALDLTAMAAVLGRPNAAHPRRPVPVHAAHKESMQQVIWSPNGRPSLLYCPPQAWTSESIALAPDSSGPCLWLLPMRALLWDALHQLGSTMKSNLWKWIVELCAHHSVWSGDAGCETHLENEFAFKMKARMLDSGGYIISAKQGSSIKIILSRDLTRSASAGSELPGFQRQSLDAAVHRSARELSAQGDAPAENLDEGSDESDDLGSASGGGVERERPGLWAFARAAKVPEEARRIIVQYVCVSALSIVRRRLCSSVLSPALYPGTSRRSSTFAILHCVQRRQAILNCRRNCTRRASTSQCSESLHSASPTLHHGMRTLIAAHSAAFQFAPPSPICLY